MKFSIEIKYFNTLNQEQRTTGSMSVRAYVFYVQLLTDFATYKII